MAKSGRPPGPIRKYSVEFIWPSDPRVRRGMVSEWREAVSEVDEQTARKSATSLRGMHCRFRVRIRFVKQGVNQGSGPGILAGEWGRTGGIVPGTRYRGSREHLIPAWALGLEPLETPKKLRESKSEPSMSGS